MTTGMAAATANAILDALTGEGSNYTANTAIYIKLHTGDPGAAGTANAAGETTREQATFGTAASAGSISNTADITWTSVSTSETYSHYSAWTASTAGTFLWSDALTASVAVTSGDNFSIPTGDLTTSFTPIAA